MNRMVLRGVAVWALVAWTGTAADLPTLSGPSGRNSLSLAAHPSEVSSSATALRSSKKSKVRKRRAKRMSKKKRPASPPRLRRPGK